MIIDVIVSFNVINKLKLSTLEIRKDNTEEIVASWQKEDNKFPIIYHKQKNGGKHRAVNKGVTLANSEDILILDSDDYLKDNMIDTLYAQCKKYKADRRFKYKRSDRSYKNTHKLIKNVGFFMFLFCCLLFKERTDEHNNCKDD